MPSSMLSSTLSSMLSRDTLQYALQGYPANCYGLDALQ
jgi:hypothetical protein